jgi:DNA-binding NarL/FixJ family response regulator
MKPTLQTRVTVLVVDDSDVFRTRLCALLREDARIEIIGEARDVREALALFEATRPDAVVLDYCLSDGTAVAVLRYVKQSAPGCVVLVLTSLRDPVFEQVCLLSGADHFFHKATDFERVPEVLGQLATRLSYL